MIQNEALFLNQGVIGAKLEQIMTQRALAKYRLCQGAGISRPTLDKILSGTVTSKTNYEKHIGKILTYLGLSAEDLLGDRPNRLNRIRGLRNKLRMDIDFVAEETGISKQELTKIESGDEATPAQIKDIALSLSTSVAGIQGKEFFPVPVMMPEEILMAYKYDLPEYMSGYWGSVGIRIKGGDDCFWYPITNAARSDLKKVIHSEVIVIPCMNNRVLVLNMKKINEVILLDDACDSPGSDSWSSPINHEDVPQVVYDALYDLPICSDEQIDARQDVSPALQALTRQVIKELDWDEDTLLHLLYRTIIHFTDGRNIEKYVQYDFDANNISGLDELIFSVYMMAADQDQANKIIELEESGGEKSFINFENVSFFDIPLREIEPILREEYEQMCAMDDA